jgi:di/tricarboxylate transporter
MISPVLILCLILAGAVVLFVTEWLRVDLVALLALAALVMTGLLGPEEAVLGFSNPATIVVGCMYVLSAGLDRTGALERLSAAIRWAGRGHPVLLSTFLMITAAVFSAFVNNTAVVAVLLPTAMELARTERMSVSRLLIPLSFAAMFGGTCTLIGTSTNNLVSSIAADAKLGAFRMFEFLPLGLVLTVTGIGMLVAIGLWWIPARKGIGEAIDEYRLREYLAEVEVLADSPLVGRSPLEPGLGLDVIGIIRGSRKILAPMRTDAILAGDLLLVEGPVQEILEIRRKEGLVLRGDFQFHDKDLTSAEVSLFEAIVAPGSRFEGLSLKQLDFRRRYGLNALAIRRSGETVRQKVGRVALKMGDALLLQGRREDVQALGAGTELIPLGPIGIRQPRREKIPLAILIVAAIVVTAAMGWVSILTGALLGSVLMVGTGCLKLEEAYDAIDWKIIFLLAGVIPLGHAMITTGTAEAIARSALLPLGAWSPYAALAGLFAITTLLTSIMSNNSTAAVLAPIGIATAQALGVDTKPFLMAVCYAASTSLLTPIGYQTNTMIYGPGGYRFWDFARAGWPVNLAFLVLSVFLIPRIWPF